MSEDRINAMKEFVAFLKRKKGVDVSGDLYIDHVNFLFLELAALRAELARGGKAIEAMEKIIASRETFLKSEMSVLGDLDMAADNFASSIHKIIEGYQQSCKEVTNEK